METPSFKTAPNEQEEKNKIQRFNLPILPQKVKFSDIDWEYFFENALTSGYNTPDDFHGKLDQSDFDDDGRVINMSKLLVAYKKAGWHEPNKFINKDLKPKINELIEYMQKDGADITLIRLSLIGQYNLTKEEEEKIQTAIVDFCMHEFEVGNVGRSFEIMEGIFPLFLDSFKILEDNLPKIIQRKYIEKTPSYISDTEENYRAHFEKQGFQGEELDELTAQMIKFPKLVWIWRKLLRQKQFKLKKKDNSDQDQFVPLENKSMQSLDKGK